MAKKLEVPLQPPLRICRAVFCNFKLAFVAGVLFFYQLSVLGRIEEWRYSYVSTDFAVAIFMVTNVGIIRMSLCGSGTWRRVGGCDRWGCYPRPHPSDTRSIKATAIPKSIHLEDGDFSACRNWDISTVIRDRPLKADPQHCLRVWWAIEQLCYCLLHLLLYKM